MKKLVFLLIVAALLIFAGSTAFAQSKSMGDFKMSAGLDFPTVGLQIVKNNAGQIEIVRGINIGLGYSAKHYFKPAQFNTFNFYWHWGTIALIVPYIGAGVDYIWPSGFYVTAGTIYLAPFIGGGFYF